MHSWARWRTGPQSAERLQPLPLEERTLPVDSGQASLTLSEKRLNVLLDRENESRTRVCYKSARRRHASHAPASTSTPRFSQWVGGRLPETPGEPLHRHEDPAQHKDYARLIITQRVILNNRLLKQPNGTSSSGLESSAARRAGQQEHGGKRLRLPAPQHGCTSASLLGVKCLHTEPRVSAARISGPILFRNWTAQAHQTLLRCLFTHGTS